MAGEWREVRIGDLLERGALAISDGYRVRNEELGAEGIPFVRGGDIGDGWINTDTADHIRPEFNDRVQRKLSRPGDAAFITKGTVGRAGRLRPGQPQVVFAPQVAYWRVLDRDVLDSGFVFYLMRSHAFRAALDGVKTHGAMVADYVSISQQHDFRLRIPDVRSQRAIAHILGTLDDKIELNRRMNETLEAMARALFKSWFIDFDPVRRNAARRRNQPSPQPSPRGRGSVHYRGGYDFSGLVESARAFRKRGTPAEGLFWELVRDRRFMGLKFRRQHQIGNYVADFHCAEHDLVIELDGGAHKTTRQKNHKRDNWMSGQSITVLRFGNQRLLDDPESVLEEIASVIPHSETEPIPSPVGTGAGGEGVVPSSPGRGVGGEGVVPSSPGRGVGGEGVVESSAFDHLFPDSFEDSELGETPKGWEVTKLSTLCATQYGYTASAVDAPVGPRLLRVTDINKRNWIEWADVPHCSIDPSVHDSYALRPGDVVVARMADPGKSAIIEEEVDAVFASYLVRLKTPSLAHSYYVYGFLKSDLYAEYADGAKSGSVQASMNAKVITDAALVVPQAALMEQLLSAVLPWRRRLAASVREARSLAATRDALLPKLISGEVRVKDADAFLGRVD